MLSFSDLTGLAGITLLLVALILLVFRQFRFFSAWSTQRRVGLALLLAAFVNLPLAALPLTAYVRSVSGDLSLPAQLLLICSILRSAGNLNWPETVDRRVLLTLMVVAGALLYPPSLSIGAFDPFRWGFANVQLLLVLLALVLLAWWCRWPATALALTVAVLGFAVRWSESTNLWTYLIDPWLLIYAVLSLLVATFLAVLRAARQSAGHGWHALALLLTAILWLLSGLWGRQPWKADEAYSFGVVYSMLADGQWLLPTLAGEPFVEKPPLVFWMAAIFAQLPPGLLEMHEAARLANVLIVLLVFGLTARAAVIAGLGPAGRVAAVAVLAGAPSFLIFTRYLTADLGLFLGAAMATLGLVWLTLARWPGAGIALGLGAAAGLMSKGLLLPAVLAITCLAQFMLQRQARSQSAFKAYGLALLVFVVAGLSWPLALWQQHPESFRVWLWDNNFGRFFGENQLGPPNHRLAFLGTIASVLFPVWLFALVGVYRILRPPVRAGASVPTGVDPPVLPQGLETSAFSARSRLLASPLLGPLLFALCWAGLLMFSATARGVYVMPAIVPLALVAAAAFAHPWSLSGRWLRIALFCAGVLAMLAVIVAKITHGLQQPELAVGSTDLMLWPLILVGATLIAWAIAWRAGQAPRVLTQWLVILTLVFATAVALYLPGADNKSGFAGVFRQAAAHLDRAEPCIGSIGLGESERGMLHYYTQIKTIRAEVAPEQSATCSRWIEQQRQNDDASRFGCKGGAELWRGERPENRFDTFRVCQRLR